MTDHPRIRGEHSSRKMTQASRAGSSPHTRGALVVFSLDPRFHRIIPAYAGSTVEPSEMLTAQKDHPRIRGEHGPILSDLDRLRGSSPHTRGARGAAGHHPADPRIIPAYAGSTRASGPAWPAPPDHPRIRGEHARKCSSIRSGAGSSPHTRGALGTG